MAFHRNYASDEQTPGGKSFYTKERRKIPQNLGSPTEYPRDLIREKKAVTATAGKTGYRSGRESDSQYKHGGEDSL